MKTLRVAVAPMAPGLGHGTQAASAASRALLRRLLEDATGVPAGDWAVSARGGAAPRVSSHHPVPLHASLSHRLGWIAAAVCDAPVGVDLERERSPRSDPRARAALMLSPAECDAWGRLAPEALEPALLTRWTVKEAWFKAMPEGAAPWDFRRIAASSCTPARANVRTWDAAPLHLSLYCADAALLAGARCGGLDASGGAFWQVGRTSG